MEFTFDNRTENNQKEVVYYECANCGCVNEVVAGAANLKCGKGCGAPLILMDKFRKTKEEVFGTDGKNEVEVVVAEVNIINNVGDDNIIVQGTKAKRNEINNVGNGGIFIQGASDAKINIKK